METKYVIGVDFGTDSCRSLIVNLANGEEEASSVQYYSRWAKKKYCDPLINQYRQHPLDYIEAMEISIKDALSKSPNADVTNVVGISFDMTGSTPALTDKDGVPLALLDEFSENPNAMFVLWKDHTAIEEADAINDLARKWEIDYTAYSGGIYSSEWVWAKVMHILKNDEEVRRVAYSWIEHTDWIPALLTGNIKPEKVIRSRCPAGHKAMWHESWGGLPSEEFLTTLSPYLKGFRSQLFDESFPSDKKVGYLTREWAIRLGLSEAVAVGVGAIDCHMGAVGAGIKSGSLVKVMGTSTCDVMVVSKEVMGDKLVPGICGQVDGSVLPNMIGLEAGQSAFGDLYAWFSKLLEWPLLGLLEQMSELDSSQIEKIRNNISSRMIEELTNQAKKISREDCLILATDWMNGRRTPNANQRLTGTISGLTLGSSAPMIFKALVEATAFGARAINDQFLLYGVEIKEVIAIGGISQKSSFVMQILADVLNMPIKVCKTEQACALGAAMCASVVAGEHESIESAQVVMGQGILCEYFPKEENVEKYADMYKGYLRLGEFSGHKHILGQ